MMRLARLPLAVPALFLFVACHGDRAVTPDLGRPSALIFDGANSGGNPDFFFLPPMVRDPSGNSNFDEDLFNATLTPFVDVCQLTGDPREDDPNDQTDNVTCDHLVFGPVAAQVSANHYQVNWHTDASNNGAGLDVAEFYRIQVYTSEGGSLLGFADLDPVSTGKELKNLRTGDVIGLIDGRTLPIRFRIEVGAACFEVVPCTQKVINLSEDNTIILEGTGDRVDIPAQNTNRVITVTLQLCDGIDVDLPTFGNCLSVTADPPLGGLRFDPEATVSMCSIRIAEVALPAAPQDDLVTMHRQDNGDVFALPHADDFCEQPITSAPTSLFGRFARAMGRLFAPRTLHATTAVLNVGDAGDTDLFSDFQLALPAQMEAGGATTPTVFVADRDRVAVADAFVTFEVTSGGGTITARTGDEQVNPTTVISRTGVDGIAALAAWTLGSGDANTVRASGFGIAGRGDEGPFMPDITLPTAEQTPVSLETGELLFSPIATLTLPIVCAPRAGGDQIFRGFYVPRYPNATLDAVTLYFSARTAGTYTLRLTARAGAFDGAVIATATTSVTLTAVDTDNRAGLFTFTDSPLVAAGTTVAFTIELVSGPSTEVFFAMTDDRTCPVVETENTSPPLSTPRFGGRGVGIRITGTPPSL